MKKGFVLILILVILLQSSIRSVYVAYFNVNQEYIASVLCINKAKPTSSCNGKCYLSKKMKEQEQQEQTIPSVLKGLEEVVLYFTEFQFEYAPHTYNENQLLAIDSYQVHHYSSSVDGIIHPPQ